MAFRFERLKVFRLAIDFVRTSHELGRSFPKEEVFGLTANLRRAATSIALNFAEGSGRGTRRDFAHFLDVASDSLFETVAGFLLAERLGWVRPTEFTNLREDADRLARKLSSFKKNFSDAKR